MLSSSSMVISFYFNQLLSIFRCSKVIFNNYVSPDHPTRPTEAPHPQYDETSPGSPASPPVLVLAAARPAPPRRTSAGNSAVPRPSAGSGSWYTHPEVTRSKDAHSEVTRIQDAGAEVTRSRCAHPEVGTSWHARGQTSSEAAASTATEILHPSAFSPGPAIWNACPVSNQSCMCNVIPTPIIYHV